MKLKIRGADDYLNYALGDRDWEVYVGKDRDGNDIYTGDIVLDEACEEYRVDLKVNFKYIPMAENLLNYRLKGSYANAENISRTDDAQI